MSAFCNHYRSQKLILDAQEVDKGANTRKSFSIIWTELDKPQ